MKFIKFFTVLIFGIGVAYGLGGSKFFSEDFINFGTGAGDKGLRFDYKPDGTTATIIHDSVNDEFDFNKKLNVTGAIESSTTIDAGGNITSTGGALSVAGNITSTAGDLSVFGELGGATLDTSGSALVGDDLTVTDKLNVLNTGSPSNPWPQRTQAEIDVLGGASGDSVYNSDTNKLNIYNGSAWKGVGGGAGGGGSFAWELTGDVSPIESMLSGISVLNFDDESIQEIYALVIVPADYLPGNQILLKDARFSCASATGNVLFRTDTTLIQDGENPNIPTNVHTASNTEKTLTVANALTSVGDIDLTDGTGLINSVAVGPGDVLSIRFYRANTLETSSAASDASFLKFSASIDFNL
jgi:hypothetical protein